MSRKTTKKLRLVIKFERGEELKAHQVAWPRTFKLQFLRKGLLLKQVARFAEKCMKT